MSWVSLSQIPVIICREELDTSTTTALVTKSVDGCLEPSRWSTLGKAMRFHAAREQLMKLFGPDRPVWRFIAPSAPWWGGWWERLIGSVKSALKRTVRQRSLTWVELKSTLHEVEACVNSRPLSFVGDELDSGSPLTHSHFLIGRPVVCKPTVGLAGSVDSISTEDLSLRQELRDQIFDEITQQVYRFPPPGSSN